MTHGPVTSEGRPSRTDPVAGAPDREAAGHAEVADELVGGPVTARPAAPLRPDGRFMRAKLSRWIALGFGAGLAPVAPGTVGTLWAWAAFLLLDRWLGDTGWAVLIAAGALGGVWACARTGEALGRVDHGAIVWDEVVAFWLVLWVQAGSFSQQLGAFVLFRLFDIVKPPPIRAVERRVPGGWGVMADDLVAAFLTLLVLAAWRAL